MQRLRKTATSLWLSLMGATALLYTVSAQAYVCSTLVRGTLITVPDISIPGDLPLYTQIGPTVETGAVGAFRCTNSAPMLTYQEFGITSYGARTGLKINTALLFKLGDSGIGYTVQGVDLGFFRDYVYIDGTNNINGDISYRVIAQWPGFLSVQPMTSIIILRFYKIGNINAGIVPSFGVAATILRNNKSTWLSPESLVALSAFNVTVSACTVTTPTITVAMGDIKTSAFTGIGSNAGTKNFAIELNCVASAKVALKLDATGVPNTRGVMALSPSTSPPAATGVGIQLLNGINPVTFGIPIVITNSTPSGAYSIPLSARYYQTQSTITPGLANGTATFTITYP